MGSCKSAQQPIGADVGIGPYNPVNRIATEIEAAFIFSEKPYDSTNAAAVKMTDS